VPTPAGSPASAVESSDLIVVDYLQLMSVSSSMSDENRATAVGEISRGLKMLAKELQLSGDCVVAAQRAVWKAVPTSGR
jgi:replicative DNA helicase